MGYSPWGHKELDTTEQLSAHSHTHTHTHTHTHKDDFQALAGDSTYIGPLFQYSCLENPMDRAAWWAAVHGVAKSWT